MELVQRIVMESDSEIYVSPFHLLYVSSSFGPMNGLTILLKLFSFSRILCGESFDK